MKRFSLFLMLCLSLFAKGEDVCANIDRFNEKQLENIRYAYHYGKKYELGFILGAIAWKESCAGLYRLNMQDPSAGNYHTILNLAIQIERIIQGKPKKKKIGKFEQNVMAERLICDREFASRIALYQLKEWKKLRNNNLKEMLKSYNGGNRWLTNKESNQKVEKYADEILKRASVIKEFFEQNPEMYRPFVDM